MGSVPFSVSAAISTKPVSFGYRCKVIAIFPKAFKIANKSCVYRSLAFSCNREIITTDKILDRKF